MIAIFCVSRKYSIKEKAWYNTKRGGDMKEITSNKNPMIKEWKKLHKKKERDKQQLYIIEGFHLVEEAVKAQAELQAILVNQRGYREWQTWLKKQPEERIIFVSDEILQQLSDLPTAQGILAIVKMPQEAQPMIKAGGWLLLDNVQDPGNVGTMIRTADAAGLAGVLLGEGTADIYSTKVLRSMQGSNYHLPIVRCELAGAVKLFIENKVPVFGTALDEAAIVYTQQPALSNYALLLGNEGSGVATSLLAETTKNLYIPMKGQAESLNVAIAAGILMYHFANPTA
jgi:TrmH family RNA methyltransferase